VSSAPEPFSGNGSGPAPISGGLFNSDLPGSALAPGPVVDAATAAPVLPAAAPATTVSTGPGGPSKGTVAVLGVICAALLVRYLSYSTKLRRL
jgi:hypothetical protein